MAFEGLSERLQGAMTKIGRKGKITEADLKEMMREVRLALLEADVNFKVVKEFVKKVNERALGSDVLESLSPTQQVVKIVNEELTELMGGQQEPFQFSPKPPTVVMMVGLQGAGKTTTAGKLASFMKKKENKRPLLVAADVYRPAAINQLQTIGKQLDFPVYSLGTEANPVDIAKQAVEQAILDGRDLVIIDTAGRLHVDEVLMTELKNIKAAVNPTEILFTVDAMTGQDAVNVAQSFNEQLGITGVILTKLDGDTRGGAALSIRSVIGKPIKFTGQGEKLEDFEPFYPDRMASRILGMGDMLTLIERAQQDFDETKAAEMAEKIRENTFNFNDFIEQMDQLTNMGPMEDLLKMIPGMSNLPGMDKLKIDPKDIAHMKAIVLSMTPKERENPDLLSQSRRKRIAKGSARSLAEVNRMIKQFNESREMMNKMSKGNFSGMEGLLGQGPKGKMGKMAMQQMARRMNKKNKKKKK
ncbi:signal recognition particle srp54 subunit helical bundle [Trichococcus palustris]|jgi:signal recognition particle subunit SRP54|uniref:Signal recognition particle protein n=1 Tax=Trichococcus palustris TaxID=140314 RepID=A0A143Y8I0_9LACT|nr:signal recognition particle protein [Trichococcus palustris]CZQ82887.1 signal recognition particle srp54 subunit helical bundle [Trichococcus palustris]SFK68442.1 signal recognition particle subunit FFH/SRP54 (srp54) [Trichococcus palustris]